MSGYLYYLILVPFAYIIVKGLYDWLLKDSINSLTADKNIYEVGCPSLLSIIKQHRITKIIYREGSLRMCCLGNDLSNYESVYLTLPDLVNRKLKLGYPLLYNKVEVRNDELIPVLVFIMKFCTLTQRKDATDKVLDYRADFRIGSLSLSSDKFTVTEDLNNKSSKYNIELNSVLSEVRRYYSLLWEYKYIKPSYHYLYLKQIKENWEPLGDKVTSSWLYEKFTKEWYRTNDAKSMYDLRE